MNRLLLLLFIALVITGCDKADDNIIWSGSFGQGKALCIKSMGDTGFVAGGSLLGKQYLLCLDNSGNRIMDYNNQIEGLLTDVIPVDGSFIIAGSSQGKMLLSMVDLSGSVAWDTLFSSTFRIDHTSLCTLTGGGYLAVGTADPDSTVEESSGIMYVWFSESGNISAIKEETATSFIAAMGAVTDDADNIFLAITRMGTGGNMKASVAKYNSDAQKLWEKELYNNPAFGSSSLGITLNVSGDPVVTGMTGMQVSEGIETSAFVAEYDYSGNVLNKKYLGYSNAGTSVSRDGDEGFFVMNSKCLIIDILDGDLEKSGLIRTYSSCDPQNTRSFGFDIDLTPGGNIVMAGMKDDNFYLAVKSKSALSPV